MSGKRKPTGPTLKDRRELEEINALFALFVDMFVEDLEYEWVPARGGWVFKFTALHMNGETGSEVKTWEMTASQARWFLTGVTDMGAWTVTVQTMADQNEFPDEFFVLKEYPSWDGEDWGDAEIDERLTQAVGKLARFTKNPDAEASADEDLRELERITLVYMTAKLAQANLLARLSKKGAGDEQVARASAMSVAQLKNSRETIIRVLGDLSHMQSWLDRKDPLRPEG